MATVTPTINTGAIPNVERVSASAPTGLQYLEQLTHDREALRQSLTKDLQRIMGGQTLPNGGPVLPKGPKLMRGGVTLPRGGKNRFFNQALKTRIDQTFSKTPALEGAAPQPEEAMDGSSADEEY